MATVAAAAVATTARLPDPARRPQIAGGTPRRTPRRLRPTQHRGGAGVAWPMAGCPSGHRRSSMRLIDPKVRVVLPRRSKTRHHRLARGGRPVLEESQDERPTCPNGRPHAAKYRGKRPHAIPSFRLLIMPAWLADDSARSFSLTSRKIVRNDG